MIECKKGGGKTVMRKKKIYPLMTLAMLLLVTFIIFSFSLETADESSEKSGFIVRLLDGVCALFGVDAETLETPIRKAAHFAEFALLGFVAYLSARAFKLGMPSALLYSLLVAVADETIQLYSPERFSSTLDVLLDFGGAVFGAFLLLAIIKLRKKKKRAIR